MNDYSKNLARNLVYLRKKQNLSQEALAKLSEVPRTTITNMESGESNPSLSNIVKIAEALSINIESLLSRPRSESLLIKAKDVPLNLKSAGKVQMYKLLPDNIRGVEIDRIELDPHATMGGKPHLHGTKEYMTVIRGEVTVFVSGEQFTVKRNDVLAFEGNQPHSYRNNKDSQSLVISVVIPAINLN